MTGNRKAFVIGWPIEHSLSPLLHGYWLNHFGIDGVYEKHAVAPQDVGQFFGDLRKGAFSGGNITIPHKEAAFGQVDHSDETARKIGVINTVWLKDGEIFGTNTDGYGFSANLDQQAPAWREGKTAIVLGAGGAARAVLWSLGEAGYETVYVVNRTIAKAESISKIFGSRFHPKEWQSVSSILPLADLVVNTTSLGMKSDEPFPLDLSNLPESAIVSDIVYTPLVTPLLEAARNRGLKIVDGLGMLLHQAVPGFEIWFGVRPQVTKGLRDHLLAHLNKG